MARVALVLALALGFRTGALAAQDPLRVVPPDTVSFLSRAAAELFRRSLPRLQLLPQFTAPWTIRPGESRVSETVAGFASSVARTQAALDAASQRRHLLRLFGALPAERDTMPAARRGLFGLSTGTADVTFDGSLQFQVSTARTRNLKCTPVQAVDPASGCSGGFKGPNIENTVLLHSRGVFAQRMNVNLDFDSNRDYSADQVISVYYQGLEDEKLRRVDVGTVQWLPPPSRFLSASIPSNNFGVTAEAVFGPLDVRAILATQKGSVVKDDTFTIGTGVVSPQDILKRDLDYVQGRFFWVVNPKNLAAFPALDILNASTISVSPDSQPSEVRIYRYFPAGQTSGANANYDGITATGVNGIESVGPLRWRLLKRNQDYWIDPSGLWFALSNSINPNDYLAVSYTTKSGGRVGTLPTVDDSTAHDQLRLIYLPNKSPTSAIFYHEMRQVYHVADASLVRSTLRTQLLVAGSERPSAATGTFLSLLGLAVPAEQGTFDVENHVFPRNRDAVPKNVIGDALLVFPNAQPFADSRLTASERNDSLYVTPEYLLFSQGPPSKFQVHLLFDAQGGGDRGGLNLGGFQIAEGTEKLDVGGRRLVKERDYLIDYTTGHITFLDPTDLFGTGISTVRATYEQRGFFAVAPTTIAGFSTTLNLGLGKSLSFAALYQSESTPYTRPEIGAEAHAALLAGVTGDFQFPAPGLTRLMNRLVRKPTTAQSSIHASFEVDMSKPDPNRSGDAYLEQFEDDHSIRLPAAQNRWVPGSMPKSAAGLFDILPLGFDSAQAVQLVLQNLKPNGRDSIEQYTPHQIDSTLALTQSSAPQIEPVLWATLHADTAGGIVDSNRKSYWSMPRIVGANPRWRTMTTGLSPTGLDLTRNDYFEFALYQDRDTIIKQARMRIVIDLGRVSEDAISLAPTDFHVVQADGAGFRKGDTLYTGRQYVGVGRMDTERNFFGSWSATVDDNGILGDRPDSLIGPGGTIVKKPALCRDLISATILLYPWGDLGARCTANNGNADSEDLDGDNVLDAQGSGDDVFRYVINLATDSAKYFVRSTRINATGTASWTIYRVPLRLAHDTIGNPDMHLIKQMRMAFVAPGVADGAEKIVSFGLALMRFSGAAWVTRAERPILSLSGAKAEPQGAVQVGSISTQDGYIDVHGVAHGYTSPPGITDVAGTFAVSSSQQSQQINEKALSIRAFDLHGGERAEGYLRLTGSARNLLAYDQLRVWMHGGSRVNQLQPSPGWDDGRLRAYIKIGSDAYNFYLYNAPASTTTWEPEMVIDVHVWEALRLQIENARLHDPKPVGYNECGRQGDSTAWIACSTDGSYFVQIRDPQINPPNLSAVQELAAGIYYPIVAMVPGAPIDSTELWIDDVRVGLPVSRSGLVGAMNARAILADVATLDFAGVYQNAYFQQLGQTPSYQNVGTMTAASTLRLEKFLPTRFGLLIPVSISSNWGWVNQQLITGTDVEAGGIDGLRRPRNDATQWQFSIQHPIRESDARLTRLILSPFSISASGTAANVTSALSESSVSSWQSTLRYVLNNRRRPIPIHMGKLTRGLPRWLRESSLGRGISEASFAPIPTLMQYSSSISHTIGDFQGYQVPIRTLADTILKPVTSEQFLWRNQAAVNWEPFSIFTVSSDWSSTRDLRDYPDSTSLARIANAQHRAVLGADVGVERDRTLRNTITFSPRFASWLGTSASVGSSFVLSRSLTSRNPVRIDGDTAGAYILPQTLNNSRAVTYRVTVDPLMLSRRIWGDSSRVSKSLMQVQPILFTRTRTLESTFDLARFNPGLDYQLGFGGLNSFLTRDGENAIGAVDATATTVAATVDLPIGLSAQIGYSSTSSDRYQLQGTGFLKSTGTTESWPSGRLNWSQTLIVGPLLRFTLSAGMQRDRAKSSSPFADGTGSEATSETRKFTPDVDLTMKGGMRLRFRGEFDKSDASYGGNVTKTDGSTVSGDFSWSTRMPRFISAARRNISSSLSVIQNNSSSCIQRTADAACVSYYDLHRLEVRSSFAGQLANAIRTGLSIGYTHNSVATLNQVTATITLSAFVIVPLSIVGM